MNIFRIGCTLVVLHALAGCAVTQETRRSLNDYTQAMSQVTASADAFLTDFSKGLKAQDELKRLAQAKPAAPAPEYPDALKLPDAADPPTEAGKRVTATRQALVVVRNYNDTLVALASGKSESEIREGATKLGNEFTTLAALAGTALPALAPLIAIGPKLAKLAQDANNRKQLEQAIAEGSQPVASILLALEEQAPVMYKSSADGARQAQDRPKEEIRRKAPVLKALIARHSPPKDAELVSKTSAQQALVGEIGRKTRTLAALPVPFVFTSGKPAYDKAADDEATVIMESLSASAQKYAEIIVKQNAYHDSMQKYVILIRTSRSSMEALEKSLSEPRDLRAEVDRLLGAAFDLRDSVAAYRNPPAAALQ